MSLRLFLRPDGSWSVECGHCGGPLADTLDQPTADQIMDALQGIPALTEAALVDFYGPGPFGDGAP